MDRHTTRRVAAVTVLALTVAACGSGNPGSNSSAHATVAIHGQFVDTADAVTALGGSCSGVLVTIPGARSVDGTLTFYDSKGTIIGTATLNDEGVIEYHGVCAAAAAYTATLPREAFYQAKGIERR